MCGREEGATSYVERVCNTVLVRALFLSSSGISEVGENKQEKRRGKRDGEEWDGNRTRLLVERREDKGRVTRKESMESGQSDSIRQTIYYPGRRCARAPHRRLRRRLSLQKFTFVLLIGIRAMDRKVTAAKDFRSSSPPSQMHSSLSLAKRTPRYIDNPYRSAFQVCSSYLALLFSATHSTFIFAKNSSVPAKC